MNQAELMGKKELEIITGLFAVMQKMPNGDLPDVLKPLAAAAISNVMLPLVQENKQILDRQIERMKETLKRGEPRSLSKTERSAAEKQRQQDAEFLKKNMTPRELYYAKPNTPDFNKAKKVCRQEMTPEVQRVKDRYIQTTRALDPDDDSRDLIERLRPSS